MIKSKSHKAFSGQAKKQKKTKKTNKAELYLKAESIHISLYLVCNDNEAILILILLFLHYLERLKWCTVSANIKG